MTTQAEKDAAVAKAKDAIDELALLIPVAPPVPPTNVALGATATASSTLAGYPLAAINDGERKGVGWSTGGGGWANGTLPLPAWVQINFSGAKSLSSVNVFTLQDDFLHPVEPTDAMTFAQYGIRALSVQAWDGTAWQTIGSVANNNKVKIAFAAALVCNALRVTVTDAMQQYARITETEAFGVPSSAVLAPPPGAVVPIPPPTGQTLAELVAAMPAGSWAELTTSGIDAALGSSGATKNIISYTGAMPWDAAHKKVHIVAGDHGLPAKYVSFTAAGNSWQTVLDSNPYGSHGFEHTAVDGAGEVYLASVNTSSLRRFANGNFDTLFSAFPTDISQIGAPSVALAHWSGALTGAGANGALVVYVGAIDAIWILNLDTKTWTTIAADTGHGGWYHTVIAYSAVKNCAIYGGGNDFQNSNTKSVWRLKADGSKTKMPDAPFIVGIAHGMIPVADPASGNFLFLGFGQAWMLNPDGAGTWTQLTAPPSDLLDPTTNAQAGIALVSCPTHGVALAIDALSGRTPLGRVRVYKPFSSAPAGGTGLTATLDFGGGKVANFNGGTDLGTFDDPDTGIHQRCFMATDAAFPDWRVLFCPDVSGLRDELIVLRGTCTVSGTNWTTPYTATVSKNGATVYTATVPKHFWAACWRYQSAPRPVVRTPATLKARGWIPNFGTSANPYSSGPAVPWGGPMSIPANMNTGMGTAGDNSQIGLLTEAGADYMLTGSAAALTTIRTEAEAMGSWPIHAVNADGGLLNARGSRYPEFASNPPGSTVVQPAPPSSDAAYMLLDAPHQYASGNAAWLLTGDPFYLRCLQAMTNWHLMFASYHRINQHLEGLLYPGETRAMAWGLRDLSLLACSTPAVTPTWLLPRSVFKADLDDNLTYAMRFVNAPARLHSLFRAWIRVDIVDPWMSAWLTSSVGRAVLQGFTEWRPVFDWAVGMQIAFTNGTSGWNRQLAAEYDVYYSRDLALPGSPDPLPATTDAAACTGWADAYAYHLAGAGGRRTPLPAPTGDSLASTNGSYAGHVRAALAVAAKIGTPGAQACFDWLHAEVVRKFGGVQARFAVDP